MHTVSSIKAANDDHFDELFYVENDLIKEWLESLKLLALDSQEAKDISLKIFSYLLFIEDGETKSYPGGTITRHGSAWVMQDLNTPRNVTDFKITNNATLTVQHNNQSYLLDFNSSRFSKNLKQSKYEKMWNGGEWKLKIHSHQSNNLYNADVANNIKIGIQLIKKRKDTKVIFAGTQEEQFIDQERKFYCELFFEKSVLGNIRFLSSSDQKGFGIKDDNMTIESEQDQLFLDYKVIDNDIEIDVPFFGTQKLCFQDYLYQDGNTFLESIFSQLGAEYSRPDSTLDGIKSDVSTLLNN